MLPEEYNATPTPTPEIDYRTTMSSKGINEWQRRAGRVGTANNLSTRVTVRAVKLGLPVFLHAVDNERDTSGCGPKRVAGIDHPYVMSDFSRPAYRCGRAIRDMPNILPRPLPAGCGARAH